MNNRQKQIAEGELKALSVDIGLMWIEWHSMNYHGKTPDPAQLAVIVALTDRYSAARTLYDAGAYLKCIEALTSEAEAA